VQAGQPSRTAEYVALYRALEGARRPALRLFHDPLAREFLRPSLRRVVGLARVPGVLPMLCRYVDRGWPGSRTSAVARTRWIDERVRAAVAGGAEQLVLLGAGFDARPYRLPECRGLAVFEVDHPATQAAKRAVLARVLGAAPSHVRFVPTDFDRESVATTLPAAGWDATRRTLFVWEGVTNYLSEAAVDATLRSCARAAPGSELVFTYVHRGVIEDPSAWFGTARLFRGLAAMNERWTFGLDPARTPEFLHERGLALDEDLGAANYRALAYGRAAAAAMRGYEFYRVARAHVTP
jgi:methyltransferase (TIGR00027 family)